MTELSFSNPPIREVSYSIQFKPINGLHIGHLGMLWGVFKDRFPNLEHSNRLPHEVERFGVPENRPPALKLVDAKEPPRIMMISDGGERLLQVQDDRFIFNWRKSPPEHTEYPRYSLLSAEYKGLLEVFHDFLQANNLGDIVLDQVEVSNFNYIDSKNLDMAEIFTGLSCGKSISDSQDLEGYAFNMRHTLLHERDPVGRVHTFVQCVSNKTDGSVGFAVNFTARSHMFSGSSGAAQVMDVMNFLRKNINESFKNLTTPAMHADWGLLEKGNE